MKRNPMGTFYMFRKTFLLAAMAMLATTGAALARDQIRIVGSSTVFPFATTVAERFGKTTDFKTPVVEATGSGGGLKLFCAGVGTRFPDIANSSRRIKASEVEMCAGNGVVDIVEVKIGYDGIVIANSKKAKQFDLTLRDVFLALAREVPGDEAQLIANPYKTWKDLNADLPAVRIEVLGPPPTSGTRDAFVELAMEGGCKSFDWIKALAATDGAKFKSVCHTIREDGAYVEAGENDNLVVKKLEANPDALGIFGFSFLDQNADKVQGSLIEGAEPDFGLIANGEYPVSRPLYIYVKAAHVGGIPGIAGFLDELTSDRAVGKDGYLGDKGLIPMPDDEREEWRKAAAELKPLSM